MVKLKAANRSGFLRRGVLLLGVFLVIASAGLAFAATQKGDGDIQEVVVTMENFAFKPESYVVTAGEKIRFVVKNPSRGFHTFTVMRSAEDRESPLVDLDAPPGQDQVVELEMPSEETTLFLVCVPHEFLGMVGEIVVSAKP